MRQIAALLVLFTVNVAGASDEIPLPKPAPHYGSSGIVCQPVTGMPIACLTLDRIPDFTWGAYRGPEFIQACWRTSRR